MRRALLLLAALLCLPLLGGCDAAITERQTFVLCLSLDTTEDGKLSLGVLTPMNGEGASTGAAPNYAFFSAMGDGFEETLSILAASTPCPLNFCQLRLCVVSYDLAARQELRPLLKQLTELHSMRPDAVVMIAVGKAEEAIRAINPDFGMRISTYLNIYLERMIDLGLTPGTTLTDCVRGLGSGRGDPLLSICAVNPVVKQEQEKQSQQQSGGEGDQKQVDASAVFSGGEPWSAPPVPEGLMAGALPRQGNNPIEYLGSAAVGNGRVSGLLDARETELLLRLRRTARIAVAIDGQRTQLQLRLPKEPEAPDAVPPDEALRVLQKLQALHCDGLGFGGACARTVYTDQEWTELGFENRYARAELYVE